MGKANEYNAPAHKSSTVRGSYMSDESSGVEYGLSARKDFDSEASPDVKLNNEASVSGNPRACIKPREGYSVSEKGHSFTIGD
ncbi:MAG: hypothetical protein ACYTFQ_26010 [Planctomycetota bacterium]|jgi:hypothetical protein